MSTQQTALVAGATRGAGRAIATELGRAGLHVYATGRSSRVSGASEIDRPETIEETAERVEAAGGTCTAVVVDHSDPEAVSRLVRRIDGERGRLDVLVNDIFGGDRYAEWDKPLWEHSLEGGRRMLDMGLWTHLVTLHHAMPLLIETARERDGHGLVVEMTDGTHEANRPYRHGVGFYYDFVKAGVERIVTAMTAELGDHPVTAMGVTPGWLRSENMLENFGVTEATWRDACHETPEFAISESPTYVARGVAALATAGDVERWSGTVASVRMLADAYGFTDADGSRPDAWGHLARYGWGHAGGEGIDDFR